VRASPPVVSAKVAKVLRDNRDNIALALVEAVANWEKFSSEISSQALRYEFSQRETIAFVDYLSAYFETGDTIYRDLYVGEKLKQCYDPTDSPDEAIARRREITALDEKAFLDFTAPILDRDSSVALARELSSLGEMLTRTGNKLCRVLLVGDCLYLDLLGFLTGPLLEAGIQLIPTFVTNKLISGQHREILQHQAKDFDLIFFSPLTYAFHIEFSELQSVRSILGRAAHRQAVVEAAKRDIKETVRLLKDTFDCPIFIHNTANIRRYDGTTFDFAKTALTRQVRKRARREINAWLPGYLDGINSTSRNAFLLDEAALLQTQSERLLSRTIYTGPLQHPAYFGRALAPLYENIITVHASLSKKKLIICDLDNTLWMGLIGEGAVEHFAERQDALLTLRKKGMLLAICSKNDARNVHWRGSVLSEEDFVCQEINWDSKVENIKRIARRLNLKTKDFVFIDDRADERALVAASMPEIAILDAESPRTWSQLSLLSNLLNENADGDRTLAYKQREERERFLDDSSLGAQSKHDESEALKKLQLELQIRFAHRDELGRVAELINRTNQFNLTGLRTSLQEVTRWSKSDHHKIWVAEAQDKFGKMGTISVAVTEKTSRGVEILSFVLSCRVFGFGMESALLSRIKCWMPDTPIFGLFKETPYNGPCHRTYPDNGFSLEGSEWVFRGGNAIPDVSWLTVNDRPVLAEPARMRAAS